MMQKEWLLSLLYVGSSNLASIAFIYIIKSKANYTPFSHPIFLALIAYIGEYLCLPLSLLITPKGLLQTKPRIPPIKYWLPALLDSISTILQIIGLIWLPMHVANPYVAISLLSTIFLSSIIFRTKFPRHQILAFVLIAIGQAFIALEALISGDFRSPLLIVLIVVSQVLCSLQICIEEFYFKEYEVNAFQCAGYEGLVNTTIMVPLLAILQVIPFSIPIENSAMAIYQILSTPKIISPIVVYMLSMMASAMSGQGITKELSGVHKVMLNQIKTASLWCLLLMFSYVSWVIWVGIGYVIVLIGVLVMHEVIIISICNFDYFTKAKLKSREYFDRVSDV